MLTKLLKYDFKTLFKSLTPIYLIAILIAFLTRIFNIGADKISLLEYPAGIISGLCILLIIGIPFVAFILSIIKYYNNMVKDEGYLTNTLPVKKSSLVMSKLISSTIAMGASIIVSIAVLFLAFNIGDQFFKILGDLINEINKYDKWIILLVFISIVIGHISNMLLIYASISLGQMHNGNKALYSVIYGIVIYNVTQIVTTIILFVPAIFNKNYLAEFEQNVPAATFINMFLIFAIIVSIVICVIYYFVTVKALDKKLNLD